MTTNGTWSLNLRWPIAKAIRLSVWHSVRLHKYPVSRGERCKGKRVDYHPIRNPMKIFGLTLLTSLLVFGVSGSLFAQSEDPSEVFLKAYMTSQQAEKLEHENNFREAISKFRFAGSLLEQLRKDHSDWQPAIVEYRSRKIGESILRVEGKLGTQEEVDATTSTGGTDTSSIPAGGGTGAESGVELSAEKAGDHSAVTPTDAAIQEATRTLRLRVDELDAQLQKSRGDLAAAQKEKDSVVQQLQQTTAKLDQAQREMEKTKSTESELRDQLDRAQDTLGRLQAGGQKGGSAEAALQDEIAQLKKTLASAEAGRAQAEKEKEEASQKFDLANKQLAGARQERDTAIAQLNGSKEAQDHVQKLITENADLKQKLADAEKAVRQIGENKPKAEQELADVKRQLEQLRQQLSASQKRNQDFEVTIADLRAQLDDATGDLAKAKLTGASAEETARLVRENDLLRGIVIREREEEARREGAKKLMLGEFDKLKIKSDTLDRQIQLLAQPVTRLSPEELALLRQPVVAISDDNSGTIKASFAYAKRSGPLVVTPPQSDSKENRDVTEDSPSAPAKSDSPGPQVQTTFAPDVPKESIGLAREAKENFDRGKYRAAEKVYREILAKSPANLYSLSNLGVVLFRSGKLKAAELTLKKAITVAPKDEFSRTTLGIVYYRQSKYDDALTELTKALAINPKSATAHNYLGITASQKGWQEAAEKEMLDAIAENPDYAEAHFNLAVIYATSDPPAKEMARRQYTKATALGAEPDPELEKLMR